MLNYVELPVLLKVSSATGENPTAPFLVFGPAVAFKTASKVYAEAEIDGRSAAVEISASEGIRKMGLGIVVGGGFHVSKNLFLSARYAPGLISIDDSDTKNGALTTMVGLSF